MEFLRFPRVFNPHNDEEIEIRKLVLRVLWVVLITAIAIIFVVETNKQYTVALAAILTAAMFVSWRGFLSVGQVITPIAIGVVSVQFMVSGNGIHDIAVIGLAGAIVVAGLFLGARGALVAMIVVIGVMVTMGIAEVTGWFKANPVVQPYPEELVVSAILFLAIGLSLETTLERLRRVAKNALDSEARQIEANRELLQLKTGLEARVEERTTELARRASQLEIISRVSRAISTVQDLDRLLPSIASEVSREFGFYHTGIFLLDERSEYAVLVAANSEGGQRMLKRGHRLRRGTTGIVGYSAAQGEARIALDVGRDSVFFNNPDLPNTRSEMALPLKFGTEVIGVLDVQSTETNAFQAEDISVLATLANQIAIAIENARLFGQTRKALAESRSVYDEYIRQEWSRFSQKIGRIGFSYDGIRTRTLEESQERDSNVTRIPVQIRGVEVGTLSIRPNDPLREWTQDELNLVRSAAERAGLAIENIRLLSEAQRRAAKERTIGEITSRIASSIDMNDIMKTAVEELGRVLPGSEIMLQFQGAEDRTSSAQGRSA